MLSFPFWSPRSPPEKSDEIIEMRDDRALAVDQSEALARRSYGLGVQELQEFRSYRIWEKCI